MLPTADKELTLPRLSQTFAAVPYTTVQVWESGATHGSKMWSCARKAATSRLLVVMFPCGEDSETRRFCVLAEKGERHMNHWAFGTRQMLPIPVPEASVAPSHEGGKG